MGNALSNSRSNRPGFHGLLGKAEAFAIEHGFELPKGDGNELAFSFSGISMPALECRNADGAGPGCVRPWVGADRHPKVFKIRADLEVGIAKTLSLEILRFKLNNFAMVLPHNVRASGSLQVGRPISEVSNFGMPANIHEAYDALAVEAQLEGATSRARFMVENEGELTDLYMMEQRPHTPAYLSPAQMLGATCILAMERTAAEPIPVS